MIESPLREATGEDCDLIARWIGALAAHEGRPDAATVTGDDLRRWCFGEARAAEAFIVEDGGAPAGCAIVCTTLATYEGRPRLHLEDLFIEPSARGRGLGESAMRSLARLALARGRCALDWSAVEGNARAIAFYLRLGAREVAGVHKFRLDGAALGALASGRITRR